MAANRIFGIKWQQHNAIMIEDVYEVVEVIMRISPADVQTIQQYSPDSKRIDVKIRSDNKYIEYNIDDYIDKTYSLRSGATVNICKPFEEYKEVRVQRISITWDMEEVKRIFNAYGTVKQIHEERFRPNYSNKVKTSYTDITTGTFRLKMKIKYDIPSTLIISRFKIEIFYFGQPQTCWRCGMDHRKGDDGGCKTEYKDFINKFSMNDFPPTK